MDEPHLTILPKKVNITSMKSNKLTNIFNLTIIALLLFTTGCYYDQVYVPPTAPPAGDISFVTDVEPIFNVNDKCTSCHSPNGGASFLNLATGSAYASIDDPKYITVSTPDQSLIYTKPTSGHLKDYSDGEAAIVLEWITQGAKNN